jgi:PKD repeat protein
LTTYDCAEQGHYCYAYFTLNCASGELESSACGEVEYDTLRGPEGFNYRWYKKSDKNNTLSEEREYVISTSDTEVYCLDVIQPTQAECYYTLETQGMKRQPVADYAYEAVIENCENKVNFSDKSYIAVKNAEGNYENSGLSCDVLWDFGDGSTSSNANPSHYYSAIGGTYTVKLKASMNGKCDSIKEFKITLPNVTDMRDSTYVTICPNDLPYTFRKETYWTTGEYTDTVPTKYGCDSISHLFLEVLKDTVVYDTICSTDVYFVDGVQVKESGKYSIKSKKIKENTALLMKSPCSSLGWFIQ